MSEGYAILPGIIGSRGSLSFGRTPYFFCLARPHGQPPKVNSISTACTNPAIREPSLALVQTGQCSSQNSGLNMVSLRSAVRPLALGAGLRVAAQEFEESCPLLDAFQSALHPPVPEGTVEVDEEYVVS
jgi:hypothetical protein